MSSGHSWGKAKPWSLVEANVNCNSPLTLMLSHEDLLMETVNEGHWERPSPVSVCAAIFLEQELLIDMISQDSSELGVGGERTVFFFYVLSRTLWILQLSTVQMWTLTQSVVDILQGGQILRNIYSPACHSKPVWISSISKAISELVFSIQRKHDMHCNITVYEASRWWCRSKIFYVWGGKG